MQRLSGKRQVRLDIQALRAVAVATVVAYHLDHRVLPGGFVGVDVFFVISGFLITSLLIERPPANAKDLLAFWARRLRRLLPASLVVLAASVAAAWLFLPDTRWHATADHTRAAALYYVNWALQADAVDYLQANATPTVVQHYWSLAVEEQFYLAWPILILLLSLFARRRYALGLGVVVAASFAYSIYLTAANPAAAYFSTWTRMWELGAGGLVAVAALNGRGRPSGAAGRMLAAAGWVAIVAACVVINEGTPFPGWVAALPIIGTMLVLAADVEFRWHAWRPVHWLGDVSYSVYLWHWPLILILPVALARGVGAPGRGTLDNAAIIGLTLLLSGVTKRYVEDRFRTPRWAGRRRATYAMSAAGMALVIALATALQVAADRGTTSAQRALEAALADADPCLGAGTFNSELACAPHSGPLVPAPSLAGDDEGVIYDDQANGDDCSSDDEEHYPLTTCVFGDPKGTADVALAGNSHAAQWAPALIEIAKSRKWRITTYIASGCGTAETKPVWDNGEEAADECIRWNRRLVDALRADPPDLIILSNRTNNPAEGEDELEDSYDEWEDGYRTRLRELSRIGKPIVILRDTPAPENGDIDNPPDCIAFRKNPDDCAGPRNEWVPVDPSADAAASLPGRRISVVDLNDYLCTPERCGVAIGGVIGYYDGSHMTATFNRTLTPYLDEQLQKALQTKRQSSDAGVKGSPTVRDSGS